jgi:alpha-mannosidase
VPHDDNNAWQDQGRQERRFWLLGGRGGYAELALDRRAEELQTPAEFVMDAAHHGTEPWEQSFLEILPGNVWVLAIKPAERGQGGTILRLQERSGKTIQATLKSSALGLDHTVNLAPWELKTLLVTPAKTGRSEMKEVSLLEM